jgi:hypothetical protein
LPRATQPALEPSLAQSQQHPRAIFLPFVSEGSRDYQGLVKLRNARKVTEQVFRTELGPPTRR